MWGLAIVVLTKFNKKQWQLIQSGKTNHFESCYLSPQLQQISELKQTTMLEWSRNTIIRQNNFTKSGLVNLWQDNFGPDFAHL